MKLDKSKKYEFCGEVYEWDQEGWDSVDYTWASDEFQHFADKGLVKEIREPIVGRGRVEFNDSSCCPIVSSRFLHQLCGLTIDQARNRTFDIVATEVVE